MLLAAQPRPRSGEIEKECFQTALLLEINISVPNLKIPLRKEPGRTKCIIFIYCYLFMSLWHIIIFFIEIIMSSSESTFPSTLYGFGYAFNKDGQLRKIDPKTGDPGNDPFEFNVSEDPEYNQKRYEALGDVITEHLYGLLETEVGLQKLRVPKQGSSSESTFVFATPDIHSNPERLLVLIHGSGAVKAGQWARSLIINDDIKSGSQIPYIEKAKELGYAVLVMNTNDNTRVVNDKIIKIKGSRNANEHADYVWKHYVKQMNPQHVAIVAHSYGGFITVELATQYYSDFRNSVFAIAFTDSVHNVKIQKTPSKVTDYLQKVARNWASHDTPLDTPIQSRIEEDIPRVSAGHPKHEMTSWSSFESVFAFIQDRYKKLEGKEEL